MVAIGQALANVVQRRVDEVDLRRRAERHRSIDHTPSMRAQKVAIVEDDIAAVREQLLRGHPDDFAAGEYASDVLFSADVRHRVAAEHRDEEAIQREQHRTRPQLQLLRIGALARARETGNQVDRGHRMQQGYSEAMPVH